MTNSSMSGYTHTQFYCMSTKIHIANYYCALSALHIIFICAQSPWPSFSNIYYYTQSQSLCKYYMILHNLWKVQENSV